MHMAPGGDWHQLCGLRHLNLHDCERVDDAFLRRLAGLDQVASLSVGGCVNITCNGFKALASGCTSLTRCSAPQCVCAAYHPRADKYSP